VFDGEVSVIIGGRAGEGISSAGQVAAQLLSHLGYRIHMYLDYPSLIKGGHNYCVVRGSEGFNAAIREKTDFIIAMNKESVDRHIGNLSPGGILIYNADAVRTGTGTGGTGVAVSSILAEAGAPEVMANSAMIGAFAKTAGIEWNDVEDVLRKSIPKGTDQNIRVAETAYRDAGIRLPVPRHDRQALPVVTGNEALAIGLLEGGLEVYYGYPMSPVSNLLHFLAGTAHEFHTRVIQPENEIAVVLMALGSAYAGTKAAVGTSGGGFCLMTEGVGLSGIAEIPLVIVLGQRTGPSTGLATYTAQSDLHFALNAGQGDVPKCVLAPGDAGEARELSALAMDIAWKYQIPVIVLSDKILCEGMFSIEPGYGRSLLRSETNRENPADRYLRYKYTDSGISPMRFPPLKGEIVRVNSHVHSENGITTEEPEVTRTMADKRLKKMEVLNREIEDLDPVNVAGNRNSPTGILCWGSNKWVCSEAGDTLGLRVIQPKIIWPFPARAFAATMDGVRELYAVETNETAQFARYVSQFGYKTKGNVLKYDGRPFSIDELVRELEGAIS
jgi:2-oxoglutarate/2-oxoacid ferredoxin oxidoreductase subunit alpha